MGPHIGESFGIDLDAPAMMLYPISSKNAGFISSEILTMTF